MFFSSYHGLDYTKAQRIIGLYLRCRMPLLRYMGWKRHEGVDMESRLVTPDVLLISREGGFTIRCVSFTDSKWHRLALQHLARETNFN